MEKQHYQKQEDRATNSNRGNNDEENGTDTEEVSVDDDVKDDHTNGDGSKRKKEDQGGDRASRRDDNIRNDQVQSRSERSAEEAQEQQQEESEGDDVGNQVDSLHYSAKSFTALLYPVSITMIGTALCTIYINDGANGKGTGSGAGGLPIVYTSENDEDLSTEEKLQQAVVNALAIIGTIIAATILLLTLYYFKFYKVLFAYLMITTAMVLGFSTGFIVEVAFFVYEVPFDTISFALIFWNIAATGVFAIFYQKGMPHNVAQVYLIIISITMAWLLIRYLPEWTSWTLLVALALYDLCAVLTPCGPLKWLVNIAQERKDPLPGLLYEAHVGETNSRPQQAERTENNATTSAANTNSVPTSNREQQPKQPRLELNETGSSTRSDSSLTNIAIQSANMQASKPVNNDNMIITSTQDSTPAKPKKKKQLQEEPKQTQAHSIDLSPPREQRGDRNRSATEQSDDRNSNLSYVPNSQQQQQSQNQDTLHQDEEYEDDLDNRTIKLGLGDFVFYSVLVGRAALFSFTTFAAVYITILSGLAMTLILLALFEQALPALPFSIILGVIFYFATEAVIMPFSSDVSSILVFV